jgi:hypothetical protein
MTRSERSPRLHAAACILIAGGTGLLGGIFGRAADPPAPAAKPAESAAPIRREPLVIRDGGTAEEPAVFDGGGLIVDLGTDVTDEAWQRDGDLWTLAAFAGRPLPIMAGQYAALFVDDVPIVVPRDLEGEARTSIVVSRRTRTACSTTTSPQPSTSRAAGTPSPVAVFTASRGTLPARTGRRSR